MTKSMSPDERELRSRLNGSVTKMRSLLKECPALETLDGRSVEAAAEVVAEANINLQDAVATNELLSALEALTEEGALLCASASMALALVRDAITLLTAELESEAAA